MSTPTLPGAPPWEDEGQAPAIQTSKNETNSWEDFKAQIPKLVEHMKWLDQKLQERRQWLRTWAWPRYYHDAKRFDMRTEAERRTGSRPFFLDPQAFATIQSLATQCTADVLSVSPNFIARGRGVEDQAETQIERLVNYDMTELNPSSEWIETCLERACVQGMNIMSMRNVHEAATLNVEPRAWDQQLFDEAVSAASKAFGPPPGAPAAFARWRADVFERSGGKLRVPAPPVGGKVSMIRRSGPIIKHEELDMVTWDPSEPTIEHQQRVYKRSLVLRSVLLAEAKRRPDLWDEEAIRKCPARSTGGEHMGQTGIEIHSEYLRSLRIKPNFAEDPYYKDAILVYQTFAPLDDGGIRYAAIGNESIPLTKSPEEYLYHVPMLPFFGMQNVRTPGASIGISEYEPAASVIEHLDAVQSQRLYWMMLQLFQPFVVNTEEAAKKLENMEPGKVIVADPELDKWRLLFTSDNGRSILSDQPVFADNALAGLRALTDLASGVYGPGRGEPAPMNRVTGAEFTGRQSGADVRRRSRLWRLGVTSCRHMIPFALALRYQFSEPSHVANISGGDPLAMLSTDNLLEAIQEDYLLTAAVIDPNAPLTIQQLREAVKMAGELGLLKPGGKASIELFTQQLQALRVRNVTEIGRLVSADVEEEQKKTDEVGQLKQQLEQAQADMKAMQAQNDALRKRVVPEIPPAADLDAELRVIEAQAQQAEQGPPQPAGPGGGPPEMAPPPEEQMA